MTDPDNLPADDADAGDVPDPGANRQALLGGVVVAVTLAIAAWLAYGVVQRSMTSPRAAGLVPDGSSAALHPIAPGSHSKHGGGTTTTHKATTTTGAHGTSTSATYADQTPAAASGIPFAALWHAYSTAWVDECNNIWKHASNGKLYDRDDPGSYYTVTDCTQMLSQLFVTADITSVAIATREGASDAASFTSQLTLSGVLCWTNPATDVVEGCWNGT